MHGFFKGVWVSSHDQDINLEHDDNEKSQLT